MLRSYQQKAVNKMKWMLEIGGKGVVVAATGSGKSHIIAGFVDQTEKPVLIICPTKEILVQNKEKLLQVVAESEVAVYSASLNTKEVAKYTLCTILSVYKKPELFKHYEVVLIDECDLVSHKSNTSYRKFIKAIGNPVVFGFTATPYRLDTIYENPYGWEGYQGKFWQKKNLEAVTTTKMLTRFRKDFWDRILCVINTHELVESGHLTKIEYTDMNSIDHSQIKLNKGQDFDLQAYEDLIEPEELQIISEIEGLKRLHKSILVFCASVEQAERFCSAISGSGFVSGATPSKQRDRTIKDFKNGSLQIVFNVQVLGVGFDFPELESVVLIRPTRSLRLYNQFLGRLTRTAEGKDYGYVYDFSGTVRSLGELESIKVQKVLGKWDVVSDTKPEGFHNQKLYSYKLSKSKSTKIWGAQ